METPLRAKILERTHILKEILNHVDDYSTTFDKIDYSALKDDVLKPVIAETFSPEAQIRGFLCTFRYTSAYKTVRMVNHLFHHNCANLFIIKAFDNI